MTYGIENYEKKQIFENRKLEPVYVDNGQTSHIGLAVNGDLNLLIRNDEKVSVEYIVPDILSAPVKKGKVVGSARYFIDNNLYTELPIYTTDDSKNRL